MSLRELMLRVMKLEADQQPKPDLYTVRFSDGECRQITASEIIDCIAKDIWQYDETKHIVEVSGGCASEFFNCLIEQ